MSEPSQNPPGDSPVPPGRPASAASQSDVSLSPLGQPPQRWQSLTVCVLLALAVWAVFGQTLRFDFVNYDDNRYVYENPVVKNGLTLENIGWAFT
ncbi:MAG: hypothetical protein ABSE16_19050, partial [Verrucomicrobiota bacterium]